MPYPSNVVALTDNRTYSTVCAENKFADANLFIKEEDEPTFNIQHTECQTLINNFSQYERDLIIAIARLETGNFTSDAFVYGNNYGGLSIDEVPLSYNSRYEGMCAFLDNLKENYFDEGLLDPISIGSKYCPVNPGWAELVTELAAEDNDYYYENYFKED